MERERRGLNAYVGPRPFEASDSSIFFGRSREIRRIVNLIFVNPILLLYAQSGAGKTSLLRAGVIPQLVNDGFEVLPVGRVGGTIPPGIKPEEIQNIFIFNFLMSSLGANADPTQLTMETLAEYLKELERPVDDVGLPLPRALIVDQSEELFTSHLDRWKNRQDFFEQVHRAIESDHLLRVVFALREEYIGEMERYAHLLPDRLQARFRLERLRAEDALEAVGGPVMAIGRPFAPGVAEKIIYDLMRIKVPTVKGGTMDVQGEFIEPVQLQVVLHDLWARLPREGVEITKQDIEPWINPDESLSKFYDEVIDMVARSPEITEEMLRHWFEEILITPLGTRAVVVRGEKETGGIPNHIVDELENQFLIRAENRRGVRWYELAHDRFIEPIQESNRRFFQSSKL